MKCRNLLHISSSKFVLSGKLGKIPTIDGNGKIKAEEE